MTIIKQMFQTINSSVLSSKLQNNDWSISYYILLYSWAIWLKIKAILLFHLKKYLSPMILVGKFKDQYTFVSLRY